MSEFFTMPVTLDPANPNNMPDNLFGSRIRGVYTNNGEEPSPTMNFDVSEIPDVSQSMAKPWFVNNSAGYSTGNGYKFKIGGSDSTNALGGFMKYFRQYNGSGTFQDIDYSSSQQVNSVNLYLIGQRKVLADSSIFYKYWWVLLKNNNSWVGKYQFSGTFTVNPGKQWEGGTSEPSDKEGDYDNTSTDVTTPSIPVIDASGVGFFNIWKVTQANLLSLGNVLWSSNFFDTIVKSFQAPMDSIVSLNIVPSISSVSTGDKGNIVLGNYATDILATKVTSQFYKIDMGEYTFTEYWASALDYDPYTSIQLFLPYIGTIELSPDDVMNKTIYVNYLCDILTGQINATVRVSTSTGSTVLYNQTGNFSMSVPVTGASYGEIYKAAIQGTVGAVTGLASAAATGGIGGAIAGAGIVASTTSNAVAGSKIQYQRGGSACMTSGYLGVQRCYVIITRPTQSLAQEYNTFVGYPSNITAVLNTLSGFTSIEEINLVNVSATDEEKDEIVRLLKEGVII